MDKAMELAKEAYESASSNYNDAVEKYHEIEEKIYAAGALIDYYDTVSVDYNNASSSLDSTINSVNSFKTTLIDDSRDTVVEYKDIVDKNIIDTSDVIGKLTEIFNKLNDELEEQHRVVTDLYNKRENAFNEYSKYLY